MYYFYLIQFMKNVHLNKSGMSLKFLCILRKTVYMETQICMYVYDTAMGRNFVIISVYAH